MRRFFRLVKHNPPDLHCFTSNEGLGKEPRDPDPDLRRRWGYISATATAEQARELYRIRGPRLGRWFAEFEIDEQDLRVVEEDLDMPGHFELGCDPGACRVLSVTEL